jgi:hypothetical protein
MLRFRHDRPPRSTVDWNATRPSGSVMETRCPWMSYAEPVVSASSGPGPARVTRRTVRPNASTSALVGVFQ